MRNKVIAILTADLHLSLNAPIWRSAEPDWFAAMARPLKEIIAIQKANNNCPVLCAGDIFDKWNSPPELINFAIDNLPENMWCIPGQHDLPLHSYDDIGKSAYWTLVKSNYIYHLEKDYEKMIDRKIIVSGFPYGYKLKKTENNISFPILPKIALIHEYAWIKGHNYTGASKESKIIKSIPPGQLDYNIICYGDNHKGFSSCFTDGTQVWNCGSIMRRNSDQIDYKPQVGLLYDDGDIRGYHLDISQDKYLDVSKETLGADTFNMKAFIKELEKLGDEDLNFVEAMNRYLSDNKINMPICNIILKAMKQ